MAKLEKIPPLPAGPECSACSIPRQLQEPYAINHTGMGRNLSYGPRNAWSYLSGVFPSLPKIQYGVTE